MLQFKIKNHSLLAALFAVFYGLFLSSLPLMDFMDRDSYYRYAMNSVFLLEKYTTWGFLPLLANEPLWLMINASLAFLLSPETVLRSLIFIPATAIAWIVLLKNPKNFVWLIIVLIYPSIVKNHIVHLRQGVAIAIFILGWFTNKTNLKWCLIFLTPFIHGSFFFICLILVLSRVLKFIRFGYDLRTGFFIFISVFLGLAFVWMVEFVGARQGINRDLLSTKVSGVGFVFWLAILVLWFFQGRDFLRKYAFESGIIIIYLGTYWTISVSARIFESGLLLIFMAGFNLTGWKRQTFIFLIMLNFIFQWFIYMQRPGFGFLAS